MRKIAVIGPAADDPIAVLGNYHGISSKQVTPLEGIEHQFSKAQVRYSLVRDLYTQYSGVGALDGFDGAG